MASADDVVAAILELTGPVDTFKLQKLLYYCQAWHLAWDGEPLFEDRIEAWANGPVVPSVFRQHRGRYHISRWGRGNPKNLAPAEIESVEAVVDFYGRWRGFELAELTHRERPWKEARERAGLRPGDRGNEEVDRVAMADYYAGLIGTGDDR
ncbi:MAG: Panacea domain-containing protein [Acidimicrobiales bacterium]